MTATIATKLVANWDTENKKVSVFQERDKLTFSITDDSIPDNPTVETGNISLTLYNATEKDRRAATLLITIFRRVLLGSNSREHRFLPIFWTFYERTSPEPDLLLALFARLKPAANGSKEVVEAHWGVWEKGAPTVSWLEARDRSTEEFLIGAPLYQDKMVSYCQHFKEVVTLDPDNRIQSIVLRCVSGLDRSLFLDEDTWALTLISAHRGRWGLGALGHGSIAWEGVEAGRYFLKWIDITTEHPDKKKAKCPAGEARIRIMDREMPSTKWMVGPTWLRTKELASKMVEYISRDLTVKDDMSWSSVVRFGFLAPLRNIFKSAFEIERERRNLDSLENCLSFAVSALQRANIFLPEPGRVEPNIAPGPYVMSVLSNYVVETEGSRIVYRHKSAKNRANDDVDNRILADLLCNLQDSLNEIGNQCLTEPES